jgi:quercetin dioxygenase-like cupin family protein
MVVLEAKGPAGEPIALQSHVNDQITYVVEGEILARVGNETRKIGEGGFFRVPANAPHGVQILTSSVRLLDVFTPPREDFRKK